MKTKTALFATGLFTLASVLTISCGGSDEDTDTGTAGKTSTAGTTATGGTSGGGTPSGGTTSTTAGTTNNNGGTTNNNGGTTNNNGGTTNNNEAGGDQGPGPGAGGAAGEGCPATQPAEGSMCERNGENRNGCDYADTTCECNRPDGGDFNDPREWQCEMDNMGAGGNGGFGEAECPDNAMNGQDCTGFGSCGQGSCVCLQGNVVGC